MLLKVDGSEVKSDGESFADETFDSECECSACFNAFVIDGYGVAGAESDFKIDARGFLIFGGMGWKDGKVV